MKLQTLQALICIEEVGSLRAAAQLLHLSQPALSAAIQQLEDELKAPLLVRTKRGVSLTSFGQAFMKHARLIVTESRRAQEEIGQLRGRWERHITFAASPAIALAASRSDAAWAAVNRASVSTACSRIPAARGSRARPFSLMTSFLPTRSKSCAPSTASSSPSALLAADCEREISSAAARVVPPRATAANTSSWRSVSFSL